jgi:hypothetical protein
VGAPAPALTAAPPRVGSKPERKPAKPLEFDGGMAQSPRTAGAEPSGGTRTKPCPVCGEEIAVGAKKCRFCNEVFDVEGLKRVQDAAAEPDHMDIPSSLNAITWLNYIFSGAMFVVGIAQLGSNPPSAIANLLVHGLILLMVYKVRNRSYVAWCIMTGVMVLNIALSAANAPGGIAIGALWLRAMLAEDSRRYCSQ